MNKIFSSGLCAALLALTSPALASQFTTSGVVEAVHLTDNVIVLRDGDAYELPSDTDVSALRAGERVNIGWNTQAPKSYLRSSTDNKHVWLIKAEGLKQSQ